MILSSFISNASWKIHGEICIQLFCGDVQIDLTFCVDSYKRLIIIDVFQEWIYTMQEMIEIGFAWWGRTS